MKRYEEDDDLTVIQTKPNPPWDESFHITDSVNNNQKHKFYKQFFGKRSKENGDLRSKSVGFNKNYVS